MASSPAAAALFLTAIPIEFRAISAHLKDLVEEVHPNGTVYHRGAFHAPKRFWQVGLVRTGMGNPQAAMEAERAIQYFRPQVAMFVGVAGGIKDVALGDVVVASRVYHYESAKARKKLEPRPISGIPTYALLQRAQAEELKDDWLARLPERSGTPTPRVHVGPIAAGEKVVAATNSRVFEYIRAHYGDALAVEMEGGGFLTTVRAHESVQALVIRGISDLVDDKARTDSAGWQQIAAENASAFAFEVLANFDRAALPPAPRLLVPGFPQAAYAYPAQGPANPRGQWVMTLDATVDDVNIIDVFPLLDRLAALTNESRLTFQRYDHGSVILIAEGAWESFQRAAALQAGGDLSRILGVAVADLRWQPKIVGGPALRGTPTAVIGLGGAGTDVARRVKGIVEPTELGGIGLARVLALDISPHASPGGAVPLEHSEYIPLGNFRPVDAERIPELRPMIDSWRSKNESALQSIGYVVSGSRQRREIGRLAFLMHHGEVGSRLRQIFDALAQTRRHPFVSEHRPVIHIVASLGGGTGSGAHLDAAITARLVGVEDATIIGWMLMPPLITPLLSSSVHKRRVEANAFVALRELERLATEGPFTVMYPDEPPTLAKMPYDYLVFVGTGAGRLLPPERAHEAIALGIVAQTGAIGSGLDVLPRLVNILEERGKVPEPIRLDGYPPDFVRFTKPRGVSTVLPTEDAATYQRSFLIATQNSDVMPDLFGGNVGSRPDLDIVEPPRF